ncbi:MAG TPA: AAA family ATPase, partial [Actinoplanes sp.]|nr:AAA family ATPase [Actinoplanes sp.]
MTTEPDGSIVTFYSFKGGTGRTMALANVAWILAANGKRVLVVDWDLESPGLHRYFSPFLGRDAFERQRTVIGLVQDFQDYMRDRDPDDESPPEYAARADLSDRVVALDWDRFPGAGRLDLLPAGRLNRDYATVLSWLKWDDFYERHAGGPFLDAVRAEMRRRYDYVLIDSRTGYSDVADICTVHMPDTLVLCFTLNEQGIEGASAVARQVEEHKRHIRIMPVPMRLDAAEKEKSEAIRAFAKERFEGLPEAEDRESRDRYWNTVFVPYQAYYNYEERLATIGDPAGVQGTLLAAYEKLTSELTGGEVSALPPMEADLRSRVNEQFERRLTVAERSIALRYSPADRIWAEWLTDVLNRAGIRV